MASIKLPAVFDANRVLIADDEPEHLEWLVAYFEAKGIASTIATDVASAIEESSKVQFRAYVIDLNIPLGSWLPPQAATSQAYVDYNGLHIIKVIRSQGNSGTKVIAYSAHTNEAITAEIKLLYCQYIVKGRPRELKAAIDTILRADAKLPKPLNSTQTNAKKR